VKLLTNKRRKHVQERRTGEGAEQTSALDKAVDSWIAIEDQVKAAIQARKEEKRKRRADLAVDVDDRRELTSQLGNRANERAVSVSNPDPKNNNTTSTTTITTTSTPAVTTTTTTTTTTTITTTTTATMMSPVTPALTTTASNMESSQRKRRKLHSAIDRDQATIETVEKIGQALSQEESLQTRLHLVEKRLEEGLQSIRTELIPKLNELLTRSSK